METTHRHRKNIRLKEYDYSMPGAYFITICTHEKQCILSDIIDGEVRLSDIGSIVNEEWYRTAEIRPNVEMDVFVIMPNHIHGIIVLKENSGRDTLQRVPTKEQFGKPTSNSIPTIVRLFKSSVTTRANIIHQTPSRQIWQPKYYEHIIRDDRDLLNTRQYILNNPLKWILTEHENMPENWIAGST